MLPGRAPTTHRDRTCVCVGALWYSAHAHADEMAFFFHGMAVTSCGCDLAANRRASNLCYGTLSKTAEDSIPRELHAMLTRVITTSNHENSDKAYTHIAELTRFPAK